MINLLCDARGDFRVKFMNRVLELGGQDITLGCHLGYTDGDFHGPSLQWLSGSKNGTAGPIVAERPQTGANFSLIASEEYNRILETTVEQLYRTSPDYNFRSHNIRHVQDYLDYFHIVCDAAATIITERDITDALFFCVPHTFYDTVFYEVARAMGVKTTVLSWSQFPGKFFSMRRVMDLGKFDPTGSTAAPYPIEKGSVPDLFYMQDSWQQDGKTGTLSAKAVVNLVKHLVRHDPLKLVRPIQLGRTLKRMANVYGRLPDWRDPFAKFFHENELAYFEHLAGFEGKKIDLSQKYIYVPLHNQPEMSTSSLGGVFRDQALLIEALARDLPKGWKIYVKENPRQGAYARGPMFFHRLSRIAAVEFMPSNASTYALAANAQFVASVTGTVGWEAIRVGTPAMVFGAAWYGSLPGVIQYRPGLDFDEIANMTIDHDALQQATGALVDRAHDGVVEQLLFPLTPDLDLTQNTENVASAAYGLLTGDIPLSFSETDK